MDPIKERDDFLEAQLLKRDPKLMQKKESKQAKKKEDCHCKGGATFTFMDVIMCAFAGYGAYKLGMGLKDFVAGYFQKPLPISE